MAHEVSVQFTKPNVAITDRVSVILEEKGTFWSNPIKLRGGCRPARNGRAVLDQDAVMQHSKGTRLNISIFIGLRRMENDIVALPFTGRS